MRQQKSKLVCKCESKGGVLTLRQAGNSKTKSSLYIQHYDSTRKSGKRSCYISKQNITLIELDDKRYQREYKPLIKQYCRMLEDENTPEYNKIRVNIVEGAKRLLLNMGWPNHVISVADKFWADVNEVEVLEIVKDFQASGIKATREQVFKIFFEKKSRFKMEQDEKKWWEEVAKSGRKILKGKRSNDC